MNSETCDPSDNLEQIQRTVALNAALADIKSLLDAFNLAARTEDESARRETINEANELISRLTAHTWNF
jgi:hypothetical protein